MILTDKYYMALKEIFGVNVVDFNSDEDAFVALIEKGMLKNNIEDLEDRVNELEKDLREAETELHCSNIKETSEKRVKELEGLKKYARDQFSVGLIDAQIKYWKELQ